MHIDQTFFIGRSSCFRPFSHGECAIIKPYRLFPKGGSAIEQPIYGDILFLVNFSMDYLALYIASAILSHKSKGIRLIVASAIGGLYAVLTLFVSLGPLPDLLAALVIPILMCRIVFGKRARCLWRSVLLFALIGLLLGGVITALCHLLAHISGSGRVLYSGDVRRLESELTPGLFTLFASLSALLCAFGGRLLRKMPKGESASVHITHRGSTLHTDAFCDSGNLLFEPISGRPCIVLPFEQASSLLSPSALDAVRRGELPTQPDGTRYRIVPCSTVGGRTLLVGFLPDACTVNGRPVSACVALDAAAVRDKALLPPQLL